jgi:acetyl esterase/lipase
MRAHHRCLFIAALLCLAVASSQAQSFSSGISSAYRVTANLTYVTANGWEGKLDVYSRVSPKPARPTVIFFHGGDPNGGTKDTVLFSFLPYLERGWNVVNVEHRQLGVTLAPAAMQNAICSLSWVGANAAEYGFDATKIITSGTSSGGWFALTTAMATGLADSDRRCASPSVRVAAVVNWFGVADLFDVIEGANAKAYGPLWVRNFPNPEEVARNVSPLTFVRASGPPVISIHGDADPVVPVSQSVRLHGALKRVGVAEELLIIPGGKHGGFTRTENEKAFTAIEAFLARLGITRD